MTEKPEAVAPTEAAPSPPPPPPPKLSKRLKHLFEYAAVLVVAAGLNLLSRRQALNAGRAIGRLFNLALPGRRKIARENILACLPGVSPEQADALVKQCWENLGAGAAEFVQMPGMSKEDIAAVSEIEGLEHLRKSYAAGKGALLVTAHYGAWELGAKVWPLSGFKTGVVARRIKNPWVNGWVTRIRECQGVQVLLSRNAVKESVRWLRQGGLLAVLIDHRVTEGGLQQPFFGRPAYTTGLPALLALRYGAPTHLTHCWREGDRVRVQIAPAMDFSGLAATEDGIAEATRRMNAVVESWIRERPEAWLWIHNRWKMAGRP